MGKNLQYKILLSLLTAGSISVYGFVNTAAAAEVIDNFYTGNDTNGVLEITEDNTEFHNKNIAGRYVKEAQDGAEYTGNSAETDGNIITGRGPGLVFEFGLAVLEYLKGKDAADEVRKGLLL